jgi:ubiquinone biosynthesis protein UbiJ
MNTLIEYYGDLMGNAAVEIERLRVENFALAAHQCPNVVGDEGGTPICKEAQRLRAENERLLAEVDALRQEVEFWRTVADARAKEFARVVAEVRRLRDENERLRAQLTTLRNSLEILRSTTEG